MILKEELARKEDVIGKQTKATLIVNGLLRNGWLKSTPMVICTY